MGWLKRRSWLERAALVAVAATFATVAIVVFGLWNDSREETAARLAAVCAPVGRSLAEKAPEAVTRRDVLRLTQDTASAANRLGDVIKDTTGDTRRTLRSIRETYRYASGTLFPVPLQAQAAAMLRVGRAATTLGAQCPSPLSVDEARVINRRLEQQGRSAADR